MIITDVQTIVITIPGVPIGQPRQRFDRKTGRNYTPRVKRKSALGGMTGDLLQDWRNRIYLEALGKVREPWDGPVIVNRIFYVPRPQYMIDEKKWPDGPIPCTTKFDLDNLDKVVMDVLSAGRKPKLWKKASKTACPHAGIYRDDCLVYGGAPWKFFAGRGKSPGCRIEIVLQKLMFGDGAEQLTLAGEGKA